MTPDDVPTDGSDHDGEPVEGERREFEPSDGVEPDGERVDGWPADLAGVTETVVATLGPNERWNHAALGIEPVDEDSSDGTGGDSAESASDAPLATARTWGRTRTRRNFGERGEAYVQFVRDPVDFVAAALDVHETDAPVLGSADAWARVEVEERGRSSESGTEVVEWTLRPIDAAVRERVVPTTNRGRAAVIEATVAASRLDVEAYENAALVTRLEWLGEVVERCGSVRDVAAFERVDDLVGWRGRSE